MKHAIAMKNDGRMRQFGQFPKHAEQLKDDMAEILRILKQRYPNLRLAYVSSRSYGGYASITLNPEPYAYESALAVRWLIQDQVKGRQSLTYTGSNAPLLLRGLTSGPTGSRAAHQTTSSTSAKTTRTTARILRFGPREDCEATAGVFHNQHDGHELVRQALSPKGLFVHWPGD
jgi:hypothetical protein